MNKRVSWGKAVCLLAFLSLSSCAVLRVPTYKYDNARTGQNVKESVLTPANVSSTQFRKLFSQTLDDNVYAQPLYVGNLRIPGKGRRNVVFVATMNNSVYAFDADASGDPLWHRNFNGVGRPSRNDELGQHCGVYKDFKGNIGIVGTPVIDTSGRTIYFVTRTVEGAGTIQRLYALDITTGDNRANSPRVIQAIVPGTGTGSSGGTVAFDPVTQNQRPGLLLSRRKVYVAWASFCDTAPYHGWIMSYDARSLAQVSVFNTTPNGGDGGANGGGIWMEGAGLAADSKGNLFVSVGNGTFDTTFDVQGLPRNGDFGNSILKLSRWLRVVDYFTPWDEADLDGRDGDVGSGGVLLLPSQPGDHPHLLLQGGKNGTLYLIDRHQMTSNDQHFCSGCTSNTNIVQELVTRRNTPSPAYWNRSVYLRRDEDVLERFLLDDGRLSGPLRQTDDRYSAKISISANGNRSGIVWSLKAPQWDSGQPAVLNAYDAVNLSPLYSSDRNGNRDNPGHGFVKWGVPVVANGKVYVATRELSVFGLLR